MSIINSESSDGKLIQVLTKDNSYTLPYKEGNIFSKNGIKLDLQDKNLSLSGEIKYSYLTPVKYDIMGPFKFLPMECKHEIVSMNHTLEGGLRLNGKYLDFTGGTGYIDGDKGKSFPKSYTWVQCNDFYKRYSIVVSIANIPLGSFEFRGCICNISYLDKEYRMATYLGVKINECSKKKIILTQRKYKLIIEIFKSNGKNLSAPHNGNMTRTIKEDISCEANFKFFIENKLLFDITNENTSYEYAE